MNTMRENTFSMTTVLLRRSLLRAVPAVLALVFFLSAAAEGQVHVAVSIAPQQYFVERIGGEHVAVTVMIPPGSEPHTYEPKPRQLTELAAADVYFTVGVAFETAWLDRFRAVNKDMRVVSTYDRIARVAASPHSHDGQGREGDEEGVDSHIWLSPPLVMLQARVIFDTLVSIDPGHSNEYAKGYRSFLSEVTALDTELALMFADTGGQNRFIVFHPSWGYFARAYGLQQIPIEVEGREPTSSELVELIKFAKENGIKAVFVQPQYSGRSAGMIAGEIGGEVITADPLAEKWSENLESVARRIREELR